MYYKTDMDGNVISCGIYPEFGDKTTDNEPFQSIGDAFNWKKDKTTGKWTSTKIDYQYIIIPTDLIPNIKSMVQLVDDVLTDQAFVIHLSKEEIITRNNQKRDVGILPISFTPCTVIEWENGDDARLAAIIKQFNRGYNPPGAIDFPCKFDSLQDFETFKQNYCYI